MVLELGATGASLRVLWVTLMGVEGDWIEPWSKEFVIPQEVMLGPGQQVRAHYQGSGTNQGSHYQPWLGLRGQS